MPQATQSVSNVIAIAFDFDDTLVPDTYDALIEDFGYDLKPFEKSVTIPCSRTAGTASPLGFIP